MSATPLGVGVIGLGVGEQHAHAFAAHADCRLIAVCDHDAAKLAQVAARLPPVRRYEDAAQLIDDPSIQIVSIASNDDDHAAQIVRALRLGKHVFSEKPLCLNAGEMHEIHAAWRASGGARLSTNTVLRRSARFRWVKQAIDSGLLGKVYCIEGEYVYGRLPKLVSGWRGRIPGYSVVLGGGIHVVDLALWMCGERPHEVVAWGSKLGGAGTGFTGTDLVMAMLRFESGLMVRIGCNFASVYPHHHRFVVHGTKATFENLPPAVSDSARLWVERDGGGPPQSIDAPYPGVAKGDLIPAFVTAVLGRGVPDVTEEEAFAGIAVCLAIERSLAEDQTVAIDYPKH
jgi:predicted dehydrogenase